MENIVRSANTADEEIELTVNELMLAGIVELPGNLELISGGETWLPGPENGAFPSPGNPLLEKSAGADL